MARGLIRVNPMSRIRRYGHRPQTAGIWLPLFSHNAPNHKTDIRRPLAQPGNEKRNPFASERDVDADAVSLVDEHGLQIAADAVSIWNSNESRATCVSCTHRRAASIIAGSCVAIAGE